MKNPYLGIKPAKPRPLHTRPEMGEQVSSNLAATEAIDPDEKWKIRSIMAALRKKGLTGREATEELNHQMNSKLRSSSL